MGPTAAMVAATAISAGSSLLGGMSSYSASKSEALAIEEQGRLAELEARQAAIQKARDVTRFQKQQGHVYLSSGVTLEGTPILVMEETRKRGQEEVNALIQRGSAVKALHNQKARQTRRAGRSAFLSGVLGAVSTGLSAGMGTKGFGTSGGRMAGTLGDFPASTDWYA